MEPEQLILGMQSSGYSSAGKESNSSLGIYIEPEADPGTHLEFPISNLLLRSVTIADLSKKKKETQCLRFLVLLMFSNGNQEVP